MSKKTQQTGDNRAMALRYLLTTSGFAPLGVEAYPQAKELYIYSSKPMQSFLQKPVWKIESFLPSNSVQTIKINL